MRFNKAAKLLLAAVLLNGCASAAELASIDERYNEARLYWGCDEKPVRDAQACMIVEANRLHEKGMATPWFSMWRGGESGYTSGATFVYIVK